MHSHVNGFVPLQAPLEGLEKFFELGIKFEERESDESHVHPSTGIRAYAEPFLALYVSVSFQGSGKIPITLNYARTRSRFTGGIHATEEDRNLLIQAAMSSIISDLHLLVKNQLPESTKKFKRV